MRIKIVYLCVFATAIIINSCSNIGWNDETEYPPFSELEVGLSLTEYHFGTEGGSVVVTTKGIHWDLHAAVAKFSDSEWFINPCYFEYIYNEEWYFFKIKLSEWFVATREAPRKLVIEVEPNTLSRERELRIIISQGNWSCGITITQSAE